MQFHLRLVGLTIYNHGGQFNVNSSHLINKLSFLFQMIIIFIIMLKLEIYTDRKENIEMFTYFLQQLFAQQQFATNCTTTNKYVFPTHFLNSAVWFDYLYLSNYITDSSHNYWNLRNRLQTIAYFFKTFKFLTIFNLYLIKLSKWWFWQ